MRNSSLALFKPRSLFWKIFIAFWLASVFVVLAGTYAALGMTESHRIRDRHADAVLRVADLIIYRYERGEKPKLRQDFEVSDDHDHHHRRGRFRRSNKMLIYGPQGDLIFGEPDGHEDRGAHLQFETTSDSGERYKVVTKRPPRPRFVSSWLARIRSVGFVLILFASALVSALLSWLITRPLRSLGHHARDLAEGNFNQPLERKLLRRGDEIGDLAREFDRMGTQLGTLIESRQHLLHDVSHELRAPLARLQAAAALSQQRGASLNAATLARVEKECERMDQLIRQILDYARIDQQQDVNEAVDLSALLTELVADVRLEYSAHAITLRLPTESLTQQGFVMRGNADLIRRGLENVLRNACGHTPARTAVDVTLSNDAENVGISIRDHGHGVDEQELKQLFNPFYRAGNQMHGDGFGLGLSIAARAIEKHRGSIRAVNHPQGGLDVLISLRAESASEKLRV